MMELSNIYIGEIIKRKMIERQVTKAELARRLFVKPQSIDYMLTRKSIDTDTLYKVSLALDYDFAQLYSIRKNQINSDKTNFAGKKAKTKVMIEMELDEEDIERLRLKDKIKQAFTNKK
jgi:hypothetical protein